MFGTGLVRGARWWADRSHREWRRATALAGLVALGACSEPMPPSGNDSASGDSSSSDGGSTEAADETSTARERAPLVDHEAWLPQDAADDPVPDHRPDMVECGPVGAYVEGTGYEIDTGLCNYLARGQPSLVELRAGDTLRISAFHETLASIEAGQAHFALLLGDWPVWQEFILIPASPGVVDATPFNEEVVMEVDVPAGTPVTLHLHNHGYNTWTLLEVEVVPAEDP